MKDFIYLVSLEIIVTLIVTLLTFKIGDTNGKSTDSKSKEQDNNQTKE